MNPAWAGSKLYCIDLMLRFTDAMLKSRYENLSKQTLEVEARG
jgi:hypothetical protein